MQKRHQLNNPNNKALFFKKRWPLCFFFLLFFFMQIWGYAAPITKKINLIEYLNQEKNHLSTALEHFNKESLPKNQAEYKIKMAQVQSLLTINAAKIQSLQGFLESQKKQQVLLNQRLSYLQQLPLASAEIGIQKRVIKVDSFLDNNKKNIELINENLILANNFDSLLKTRIKRLENWEKNDNLVQQINQISRKKEALNQKLSELYQTENTVRSKKNKEAQTALQTENEAQFLIKNQHIALIHLHINALNIEKKIIKAHLQLLSNNDTKTLQNIIEIYKEGVKQYTNIEQLLQQILISLESESKLGLNSKLLKSIRQLQNTIKTINQEIEVKKLQVMQSLESVTEQLKRLISSRQSLAEYNKDTLPLIFNKIIGIPKQFYKYLEILTLKVYDSYNWLNTFSISILWISIAILITVFVLINKLLKSLSKDKERFRLTGYLYDGLLTLIQRNTPYLCLFMIVWAFLYFTHIAYSSYQLLFNLIAVWFTFRTLILIARLGLLERISDSSGQDVKLYYRLKWLLLFGGWTTAFMVYSHVYPLSILLQDIFNRLFMLFILTVSLVGWKSKELIPYLLRPVLKYKKRYFKNAISLLVILVPITLFTTAIIGLLGYVSLAWTMCHYQACLLIVLVGYILARGLLLDALEFTSEWMISSLHNGWLWTEVFLKPMDKILRLVLILFSISFLFQLYGWHSDSFVMVSLERLAKYSIVNLTGVHITVASTLEFFILLAIFVWASKWTREFCYRWLYKDAKDAGIRNSLSVFSQYAVIILGTLIALHVLGLDFSGLSMVLGGLAVGMGFGLRDFASNIVGGIMLLIERPVREGDLITLGEYEGRVAHIGIRSMRVSSWDNMEVLIPNAETFNKPFTNWTHQDSIVRTVVPIKVSRVDDPVMIQQLILDVLAIIPEIVADPPAQVFLKQIDTALIEFEVRYFINVQLYTRFEVRSKVLFAITAQFKAAGVKAPVEPISVEFAEGQNYSLKNNNS